MEALAKEFADQVHFLFVYSREAHPGELIPHHASYKQKVKQAKMLRDLGQSRPILVDSLSGDVHRTYGGVANMSWIVDHTGRVAYKASWTDVDDIRSVLAETLELRERRRQGTGVFYREITGMRLNDRGPMVFLGGQKAEDDMRQFREQSNSTTNQQETRNR